MYLVPVTHNFLDRCIIRIPHNSISCEFDQELINYSIQQIALLLKDALQFKVQNLNKKTNKLNFRESMSKSHQLLQYLYVCLFCILYTCTTCCEWTSLSRSTITWNLEFKQSVILPPDLWGLHCAWSSQPFPGRQWLSCPCPGCLVGLLPPMEFYMNTIAFEIYINQDLMWSLLEWGVPERYPLNNDHHFLSTYRLWII